MNDNNNPTTSSAPGQALATPSAEPTSPPDGLPSLNGRSGSAFVAPIPSATPPIPATHTNPPIPATPLAPVVSPIPIGLTQTPPQPQASATAPTVPARNLSGNPSPEDIELIRAFVGKYYDEVSTRRFSWAGFFFGPFFLVYHKTYAYACLLFFLSQLALFIPLFVSRTYLITELLICLVDLLLCVTYGCVMNKLYLYAVKRKVAKIKADNPTASHEELKAICASKGGTSVLAIVVASFVVPVIFLAIAFAIFFGVINVIDQRTVEESEPSMQDSSSPSLSSTVRWH